MTDLLKQTTLALFIAAAALLVGGNAAWTAQLAFALALAAGAVAVAWGVAAVGERWKR